MPDAVTDEPLANFVKRVIGGGTPARTVPAYWDGLIPWASVKDLRGRDVRLTKTEEHISHQGLLRSAANLIPAGIPIVCTRMAVGRAVIADVDVAINQDLKALVPAFDVDPHYLVYGINLLADRLAAVASGSTVTGINVEDLLRFTLRKPELMEQRAIAGILRTLDGQIWRTEALIRKLGAARQGLVVDLLTYGVNGVHRQGENSDSSAGFKDSPLGLVPQHWDVAPLEAYRHPVRAYLKTGPFGSSLKQEHWVDNGVPVVTIGSLGDGRFIDNELLFIAKRTAWKLSAYALRPGDVVFSRVADVGRSVVVTEKEAGWVMSSNMMWIAADQKRADPRFVRANIAQNPGLRRQIRRYVNSAGRDVANAKVLNELQFPWPPLSEQLEIADLIADADARLSAEEQVLAKLTAQRQGLLVDLMTGRNLVSPGAVL